MRFLLIATALWFVVAPVRADRIRLASGGTFVGEILTSDSERVFLRTEGGEVGIRREQIVSLEIEDLANNLVQKGLLDILGGKTLSGLSQWTHFAVAASPSALEILDRILNERQSTLIEMWKQTRKDEAAGTIERLAILSSTDGLTTSGRLICIRALDSMGAYDFAAAALSRFDRAATLRNPSLLTFSTSFWQRDIRRKLALQDYPAALAGIERLQQTDPNAGLSQKALWILAQISSAHDRGNLLEALQMAAEQLHPMLPEIAGNRIVLFLKELPIWVDDPAAPPERFIKTQTLLESAGVRKVKPIEVQTAETEMFAVRAERLLSDGQTTRVLELLAAAPPTLQSQTRLRIIHQDAEYRARRASLPQNDPMALYQLGEWATAQGRIDWALEIFESCLDFEPLEGLARTRIEILRGRRDSEILQRAMDYFQSGRLFEVLETLEPVLKSQFDDSPSPFHDEAMKLINLTRSRLAAESEKRPYRAEVAFQQAERSFFVGNYSASIRFLNEVLRDYSDTPAAKRAELLLPRVIQAIEIEQVSSRNKPIPEIPLELRNRIPPKTTQLDHEIRTLLDAVEPGKK